MKWTITVLTFVIALLNPFRLALGQEAISQMSRVYVVQRGGIYHLVMPEPQMGGETVVIEVYAPIINRQQSLYSTPTGLPPTLSTPAGLPPTMSDVPQVSNLFSLGF